MRRLATIVCALAAAIALTLFLVDRTRRSSEDDIAASERRQHLGEVVVELDSQAGAIERLAGELAVVCQTWADRDTKDARDRSTLVAAFQALARDLPVASGVGVCFEPDSVAAGALSVNYLCDTGEVRRVETFYDYWDPTETRGAWYRDALRNPEGHWHDPHFGGSSQRMLIEYTRAVVRDGQVIGAVFVNWRYEDVRSMVLSLDVGGTNEVLVVADSGRVIFSGHESWFERGANLDDVAGKLDLSPETVEGVLSADEGAEIDRESAHGDIDVFWQRVSTPGWRVVFSFYDDAAAIGQRHRRRGPTISMFVVLCLLAAAVAIHHGRGESDWDVAMAMMVVFAAATAYLWWLAYEHGGLSPPSEQDRLVDHSDLHAAVAAHIQQAPKGSEPPQFIPTGVFIQSARFVSAHDVTVTGYVWQRAPTESVAKLDPSTDAAADGDERLVLGVVMPEAERSDFKKVYTRTQGDEVVVGWYFTANLRQPFDYGDYPFESEEIWIRLWPRQFHRDVVLMPDLESYDPRPASGGRGVEDDMFLPGWNLRTSYFSHRPRSYNTNFGLTDYQGQLNFPELYFNVEIQRQVISPFITHIVPLLIVLMTLFILLSVTSKESIPEIGFTSIAVIGTIVGIFFVVILQHISLRRSLQASGFVYLEVFYFLTYMYVLLVAVNAVVSVVDLEESDTVAPACARTRLGWICFAPLALAKLVLVAGARFLNRGGNRSIRFVYWPMYFGLIWLATLLLTMLAAE